MVIICLCFKLNSLVSVGNMWHAHLLLVPHLICWDLLNLVADCTWPHIKLLSHPPGSSFFLFII